MTRGAAAADGYNRAIILRRTTFVFRSATPPAGNGVGKRHSGHTKAPEVLASCSTHARHRLCPQWRLIGSFKISQQMLQAVSWASSGASASSSLSLLIGTSDFFLVGAC